MRKRVIGKKLSRASSTRRALFRALARALVINGKINTTLAKAKVAQKFIEGLASDAKVNSVNARRKVYAQLANDRETMNSLFRVMKGTTRTSGFTRIVPLVSRKGDSARMARLEFIDWVQEKKEVKKEEKKKETNAKTEVKEKSTNTKK
ncbi:50S ribosomal protein L17 [Candidatus Woesebacteria bacterium RBG_16_36_11]|uniref:50S ribosomal protein L17 n=3 Tax=Candidatus Woeseibacteriota TaxID=1752722 RepID=A0A1F7XBG7_9BACT|nr:MAG: 50S ribosomal protein L17 [Candidatus Woesebacteria bacterium RBG_13_36_22]OGM12361.1 MAG: 50S ribosomal protein L17 [Candidatus Woesebacteria bacterium RBG_16_36_11]OGM17220.1 MAG: 50S ribosomal protein L17 [Candidatus Woesebacteria bacterium RBG_19FT_COMBO_37_29]